MSTDYVMVIEPDGVDAFIDRFTISHSKNDKLFPCAKWYSVNQNEFKPFGFYNEDEGSEAHFVMMAKLDSGRIYIDLSIRYGSKICDYLATAAYNLFSRHGTVYVWGDDTMFPDDANEGLHVEAGHTYGKSIASLHNAIYGETVN